MTTTIGAASTSMGAVENIDFSNVPFKANSYEFENNINHSAGNNHTEIVVDSEALAKHDVDDLRQAFTVESSKQISLWLQTGYEKNQWAINSFSEEFAREYRSTIKKVADKVGKHIPKKWLREAKSVVGFSIDTERNRLVAPDHAGNTASGGQEKDENSVLAYKIASDTFKDTDTSDREVVAQSYIVDAYIFTIGGSLVVAGILGKIVNAFTTFSCVSAIFTSTTWASLFMGIVAAYQCFAGILALIFNNTYIAVMLMVSVISGLLLIGIDPKKIGFSGKTKLDLSRLFSRDLDEENESEIQANLEVLSANIHDIFNKIPENNMKMIPIEENALSDEPKVLSKSEHKYLRKMYQLDLGASSCLSGITNILVGIEFESFKYVRFAFKFEPENDPNDVMSLLSMGFKEEMVFSLDMDVADLMTDFETRFSAVQFYPFFLKSFAKITATMAKDIVYDIIRFKIHDTFKIAKYLGMAASALNGFHDGLTVAYKHGDTVDLF